MLVHRRVTPIVKFAGIRLYTWVERGTVRVKCLAQEHNTMSPTWARTQTARSGVERNMNNRDATASLQIFEGTAVYDYTDLSIFKNRYRMC